MTENAACGLTGADRLVPLPPLAREVGWDELDAAEHGRLRRTFADEVYPLLTPFVVDAAHPFPRIAALTLTHGVLVCDPSVGVVRFAVVQIPSRVPRLVRLDEHRRIGVDTLVGALLQDVFAGMRILERATFRLARVEGRDDDPVAVRLEVEDSISLRMLDLLLRNLGLRDDQVRRVPAPLGRAAKRRRVVAGAPHRSGAIHPSPVRRP